MLTYLKKLIKRPISSFLYSLYVRKAETLHHQPHGCLLVIAPHPDDESFGCGALISQYVAAKQGVHILIVTDGSASSSQETIAHETLASLRHQEVLDAAQVLGCAPNSVIFLNYKDANVARSENKLSHDLKTHIEKIAPTLIASPFVIDGNADHVAVAHAMQRIEVTAPLLFYPMWFWPKQAFLMLFSAQNYHAFRLDARPYLEIKEKAIRSHRSQFENITGAQEWGYLDSHIINMQLRPYELYFTLSNSKKKL